MCSSLGVAENLVNVNTQTPKDDSLVRVLETINTNKNSCSEATFTSRLHSTNFGNVQQKM